MTAAGAVHSSRQTPGEEILFSVSRVLRIVAASVTAVAIASSPAFAQHDDDHDHDHDHGPLHFSHPMFTESPSPDTKVRIDYLHSSVATRLSDNAFRFEAEYAFNHNVSLEANIPFTSRSADGERINSVGSGELALKLASFAAAERGILLGGGLSFGLPTGNDNKGIGSGHLVEVEPYVDLGYMKGPVELVTFASYSTVVNRHEGDEKEEEAALAGSLLYHLDPRFEALVELETRRALTGEESGTQVVNGGVGFKYRFPSLPKLIVGAAARVPLTSDREFRNEILVSAFWHF